MIVAERVDFGKPCGCVSRDEFLLADHVSPLSADGPVALRVKFVFSGELVAIGVAPTGQGNMIQVDEVGALEAQGLAGDRYAELKGTFQRGHIEPKQQVTLIESEAIEAAAAEYKLKISHLATRRNLLTRSVPLNHLIGREFWVGDVKLRGVKLCEPCKHLEKLSGAGLEQALRHRGGLRAEVLQGGTLRTGDRIRPVD